MYRPRASRRHRQRPHRQRPMGLVFKMGQTHVQRFPKLLKHIEDGKLNPNVSISQRLRLIDAATGYRMFDKKEDDCRKFVLTP